jgi:hypothetical protein
MTRKLYAIFVVVCLCIMTRPQFGMIATANSTTNFPVDVLLDYGDGTRTWSTCILSTLGYDTAFNATQVAADTLNYTVSEYGVYVHAINGVWENTTSMYWWALFFWNFTSGSWESSPVGADGLVLSDGDMIAWLYADSWTPSPPANPPVTQVEVMLNYGNGTVTWDMVFLAGASNAFKATSDVADTLNYIMYGDDPFVDAINGVWNNWTSMYWWALFFWNFTSGSWELSPVGMRTLELSDGDMVAWFYDLHPDPILPPEDPPVTQVEVMLNYGNGTVNWHNVSLTGISNSFKATKAAAGILSYTVSESGVFVNAINGVWGNSTHWWALFFWNFTSGSWEFSSVGAIDLVLSDGEMIAWGYGAHSWPPAPPIRGDSDGDGDIEYEDIVSFVDAYIAYFEQGVLDSAHREGDMDNDGDIDYNDITAFIDAYIEYWS